MKLYFGETLLDKMYIYEMLFVKGVVLNWFVGLEVYLCDYVTS